jgi:hypothetical protein
MQAPKEDELGLKLLLILDIIVLVDEWSASLHGPALLQGKDPLYPLDRRLGGPQRWSGHRG